MLIYDLRGNSLSKKANHAKKRVILAHARPDSFFIWLYLQDVANFLDLVALKIFKEKRNDLLDLHN